MNRLQVGVGVYYILSTYPINLFSTPILFTPSSQPTLSTHPITSPSQPTTQPALWAQPCIYQLVTAAGSGHNHHNPGNAYLCRFHLELKEYLDGKATSKSTSDAARYLPRKGNTPSHNISSHALLYTLIYRLIPHPIIFNIIS